MSSADSLQSVAPSSSQSATVLGADDSTTEDETEADGVTVSVNTAITIPNKESFTGSDYGLSSTVTVTYVDKYLWIKLQQHRHGCFEGLCRPQPHGHFILTGR